MDRSLRRASGRNRRRGERNAGTWARFARDGTNCPYCAHDGSHHLVSSGQPHLHRPATDDERRDPRERLCRHESPERGRALVKRVVVVAHAEIVCAFCTACAAELGTAQVLCFQRSRAVGEVVGLD